MTQKSASYLSDRRSTVTFTVVMSFLENIRLV
jgi:hypothetical protein